MNKRKRLHGVCRTLAALVLVLVLTVVELTPALAVTQADIDALKNTANSLASQKKQLEAKLDALADDKSQALEKKTLLDQKVSNLSSQIKNVEAQIADYAALITQTEADLAEAEAQEAAQYDLFCKRVREMEERGTVSYWSVLFKADSFTDLLSRLDIINEIMDSDQTVIDQLQALKGDAAKQVSWSRANGVRERQGGSGQQEGGPGTSGQAAIALSRRSTPMRTI